MTDSIDSSELRKLSLDFDRQFFIRKWLTQSRSHMAAANSPVSQNSAEARCVSSETTSSDQKRSIASSFNIKANESSNKNAKNSCNNAHTAASKSRSGAPKKLSESASKSDFALKGPYRAMGHHLEGQKPKLRNFNSHDTSSNMFSVADFENARMVRRNEIEMKKRLLHRMRSSNAISAADINLKIASTGSVGTDVSRNAPTENNTGCINDDCLVSLNLPDSQQYPLPADVFFEHYSTPTFVRISYNTKSYDETLQSFSSTGSTATTHSSASAEQRNTGTNAFCNAPNGGSNSDGVDTSASSSTTSSSTNVNPSMCVNRKIFNPPFEKFPTKSKGSNRHFHGSKGELFLLYKFINQRSIYHGNVSNRKKAFLIPQEFPGYFSLTDCKGLPRATQYTSIMQLVRERVSKFISVDPIPAFSESQINQQQTPPEENFLSYSKTNRLQYFRTTARAGEVYRLIAVFEDGNCATNRSTNNATHTHKLDEQFREKEKGRYAQLMNDARKIFYASLSIKGKFYEVEPGVPFILQRTSGYDIEKKINPDCVYRITDLVTPKTSLPVTLSYISGPNTISSSMAESISITKISKENALIVCPLDETEKQSTFNLHKLCLTEEMNFLRSNLGFDTDKNMWSDPNVQSMLKYCQFNCDLFIQTVEKETLQLPERPCSKQRCVGVKLLKPLHLTKLLRKDKSSISADEKEGSIIFLTKTDLDNLEAKENASCSRPAEADEPIKARHGVPEKLKVFQPTKKKWFGREDKFPDKFSNSITSLDAQMKVMSMERYKDMSKLVQDRFGEKSNWTSSKDNVYPKNSSKRCCSDTANTALTEIKTKLDRLEQAAGMKKEPMMSSNALLKSLSLQDIETQCRRYKPETTQTSDSISEAELSSQRPQITSFITEKLYNEFHEKSRKFSKSSSSLQKLLHFSQPQKMQLSDHTRVLAKLREDFSKKPIERTNDEVVAQNDIRSISFELASPTKVDANGQKNTSIASDANVPFFIEDELPYSSVRDSLVLPDGNEVNVTTDRTVESKSETSPAIRCSKEEVSDEAIWCQPIYYSDDFGDYASLYRPEKECSSSSSSSRQKSATKTTIFNDDMREKIEIKANSTGFPSVLLNTGSLHRQSKSYGCESYCSYESSNSYHSCDRSHVTTVELLGPSYSQNSSKNETEMGTQQ